MTTAYEFALTVDRDPTDYAEALFDVAHGDLTPEGGNGAGVVHACIEGDGLTTAIALAVVAVESVGLAVTGIQSDDLVTLKDIAERLDRSYESVRLWATGKRGPGNFPAAISGEPWALYSWAEVSAWLAEHQDRKAASAYDRELAAADYALRARRLAGHEHRADMAKLLTA